MNDNKNENKRKYTTITIPTALYKKIKENISSTGFSSVSDYVTYIIRETTSELELSKKNKKSAGRNKTDKEYSSIIKKFEALGYA